MNQTGHCEDQGEPHVWLGFQDSTPAERTILVVEDEDFVRNATCDILERKGYRVLRARNAIEALTAFRDSRCKVDLLISDVVLSGQNGPELARELCAVSPELQTVFISGYPPSTLTRYGITTQQATYLPKPFSAELLLQRVQQIFTRDAVRSII